MTPTQYGKAFVRWWWLVVAGLVLGIVCGLTLLGSPGQRYVAVSNVLVSPYKDSTTNPNDAYTTSLLAQERVENYASIADNPTLVSQLASATSMTVEEVTNALSITVPTNTTVIVVRFTDSDRAAAVTGARDTAARIVTVVTNAERRDNAAPLLQAKITNPAMNATALSPVVTWRNPVLASVAGLLLGLGAAVVAGRLDRRLRLAETTAAESGAPVLGRFPRDARADDPDLPALAPVREVRAEVLLATTRAAGPQAVLLCTPRHDADGFAALSVALARSLTATGRSVALLEVAPGRPGLASVLRVDPAATGLVSVVDGATTLPRATQQVDGLDVLVAGEPVTDPADLQQSTAFAEVLDGLLAGHDLVVVTAAGLDSELVALGARCSSAVVVVDAGRTRRAELRETVTHLQRSGTRVVASLLLR